MRVAIIYQEQASSALVNLLNESGRLVVEMVDYAQIEEQLASDWQPTAIFCELYLDQTLQMPLSKLTGRFPHIPIFSFAAQSDPQWQARSLALGFTAHLDEKTTSNELQLHLYYGQKIVAGGDVGSSYDNNGAKIRQTLAAVTSLHFSLDSAKIIKAALENLPQLISVDSLALFISTGEGDHLELIGQFNAPHSPQVLILNSEEESDNLLVRAAICGKSILINNTGHTTNCASNDSHNQAGDFKSAMYLPLHTRARLFGVLEVGSCKEGKYFTNEDLEFAEGVALALAVALANASSFTNAERLGQIDDLTQLYNSRHLYQVLETEMKRSRRYKIPVSVIFLDLDGFKSVNDTKGHLCGSATLTEVANLMIGLVRETDVVARYGGDEFVIVLPETPAERAVTIAERIRQQIEAHVFRGGGESEIYLTASFGVASYPEHASSPAALIRCADKAMYLAKEYNKNQVVLANQ